MSKITVETTGQFMLIDRTHGYQEIDANGPSTVPLTSFVERKLREGSLRKIEDAEPTDGEPTSETTPPPKAKRGK